MTKRPHVDIICAAKTRQGTLCKNPAGFRTSHLGTGRCYLHGGSSTGPPKGNLNALKTGEHAVIWLDTLSTEEQDLYHQIDTDKIRQLDQEIRLIEIRERRMLNRIAELLNAKDEEGMTVVEISEEIGGEYGLKKTKKRIGVLGQIQAIEEALTRVQEKKARLIELKHRMESELPPDESSVDDYVKALGSTAEEVWSEAGPE